MIVKFYFCFLLIHFFSLGFNQRELEKANLKRLPARPNIKQLAAQQNFFNANSRFRDPFLLHDPRQTSLKVQGKKTPQFSKLINREQINRSTASQRSVALERKQNTKNVTVFGQNSKPAKESNSKINEEIKKINQSNAKTNEKIIKASLSTAPNAKLQISTTPLNGAEHIRLTPSGFPPHAFVKKTKAKISKQKVRPSLASLPVSNPLASQKRLRLRHISQGNNLAINQNAQLGFHPHFINNRLLNQRSPLNPSSGFFLQNKQIHPAFSIGAPLANSKQVLAALKKAANQPRGKTIALKHLRTGSKPSLNKEARKISKIPLNLNSKFQQSVATLPNFRQVNRQIVPRERNQSFKALKEPIKKFQKIQKVDFSDSNKRKINNNANVNVNAPRQFNSVNRHTLGQRINTNQVQPSLLLSKQNKPQPIQISRQRNNSTTSTINLPKSFNQNLQLPLEIVISKIQSNVNAQQVKGNKFISTSTTPINKPQKSF